MASSKQPLTYATEVKLFRLAGIAFYQSIVDFLALTAIALILPCGGSSIFTFLLSSLLLLAMQMVPSAALSMTQVTIEPQPVFLEKLLPRSWRVPPGKLLPMGRMLGRSTNLAHLWRLLALLGAYSLAGAGFLGVHLWTRGHGFTSGATAFGALLGIGFSLSLIARGMDTLDFPVLQRHRIFRLKKRKREVVIEAALIPLVTVIVLLLLSPAVGWGTWRRVWGISPGALLTSSFLCTFCFSIGRRVVQVVSSEQLTFLPPGMEGHTQGLDSTSNAQLYKALNNEEGEAFQTLALLQLCSIAENSGNTVPLRRAIFADDTGASWQLPAKVCLQEIEVVVKGTSECLPQSIPKPAASSSQQAPQWNQRPLKPKQGLAVPVSQQDTAAWLIRSRYQRVQWAVRALAGFAAASRAEDSCGVLQSVEPGLGAVVQSLLSLALVLRQHNQTTATTGSRRREEVTDAGSNGTARYGHGLHDEAMTAVWKLANVFGPDLQRPLLEVGTKPVFGSPKELSALLDSCLKAQARH